MKTKIWNRTVPSALITAMLTIASPLLATNRIWIFSPPSDNQWSDASNWGGTGPVANTDTVLFNDSSVTNLNADLTTVNGVSYDITGLTFGTTTNSSYVITNAITLNGGINDNSSQLQTINASIVLTNSSSAKTFAVAPGASLVIGGVIGNYPLAGQNISLVLGASMVAPDEYPSGAGFNYPATGLVTFNGALPNTYTNTTTVNAGVTLLLDFANLANPVNLINSTNSALTLGGGIYSLKGNSSGTTLQTNNGTLTLNTGGAGVTLNPNGGTSTALTLGNTWTRNAGSTLNVDISAGGNLVAVPATVNGVLGYATVKDATGIGFATTNLANGNIVRYTSATALTSGANSLVTNFITSGNLTMNPASFAVNSLTLDATAGNGVLDLGGANDVMTNTARGILMLGGNNYTIQNGNIATNNGEIIIHQMGAGTLNLNATIGSGSAGLTKDGPGTLVLNGASTNSGTTTINRGTVKLGIASTPGSGPVGNTTNGLTINAGGMLDLNGNNLTVGTFNAGNGIGIITNSAGGPPAVITVGNGNSRWTGISQTFLCGNVGLKITGINSTRDDIGTGTAQLQNTFTGGVTWSGNNLSDRVVNPAVFGSGPITFGGNGGFFIPSSGITGWNLGVTNAVVVTGTGNSLNWQPNSSGNLILFQGPWTGSGSLTNFNSFNNTLNWSGDMSGFQGTLYLQTVAGYTGTYTLGYVNTNTMTAGSAQAVWDVQSQTTGNVNFQYNNTNTPATVRLGDLNTAGNAATSGNMVLRDGASGTVVTFEVGALNLSSTFGGQIINNAGTVNLTKIGTGVWTLTNYLGNADSYSGTTTVSNGLLVADCNLSGGGPVNVFGPGGLGGNNTISGLVTLAAGTAGLLLTNNAAETLTLSGGLTLSNANVLAFDVGSTSDQINVAGSTFTQNGTATIYITQISGFGAGTYDLIVNAPGILTNNFMLGNNAPGYSLMLTNPDAATLALVVTVAAPSAAFWHNRSGTSWTTANNWDTTATGNTALLTPPSIPTDVTFAAGAANNFNTTLGADFSIHTLMLTTPNNVAIGGANTLTIVAGLTNDYTAANNVINTKVALGTDQNWVNNSANSLVVNSNISGAHALTILAGSTNILLNGVNTYSGGTVVASGTLTLGNPTNTLADAGAVQILNNSTLDLEANSEVVGPVTMTLGSITGTSGSLRGSAYNVENGTITASLAGTGSLTKIGAGETVLLTGANSYVGGTTVRAGTLQLGNNSALGSGNVSVANGAQIDLNGYFIGNAIPAVTGDGEGNGAIQNNSSSPAGISGPLGSPLVNQIGNLFVTSTGNLTLSDVFGAQNGGSLTFNGPGTLILNGTNNNSLTGQNPIQVTNNSGTLVLAKTSGQCGDTIVINGGMVMMDPAHQNPGNGIWNGQINGGVNMFGGVFDLNGTSSTNNTMQLIIGTSGLITNSSVALAGLNLNSRDTATLREFDGDIQGNLGITMQSGGLGSGRVNYWTGQNTYTGDTTISFGTLVVGPSPAASTNSTFNVNVANGLQFINDTAFTLGGLGGTQGIALADTNGSALAITIGANNASTTNSGAITGGGSLTKVGTGSLTLSGTNTYTGATTVSSGALMISTLSSGGGSFTVSDGALLGAINAQNGAGAAMSSLTLGSSGPTTNSFQNVASPTVPVINAAGAVTVNGNCIVWIPATNGLVAGNTYPLIKYGSLAGAGFNGFTLNVNTNITGVLTNDTGNSWVALIVKAINTGVNGNPTNIMAMVAGNMLSLTWPGDHLGWRLLAQTNSLNSGLNPATNAWFTVSGSTGVTNEVFTINPANAAVFYRLVYP